jgi:single-strand DNA-binding protein
MASYNRVILIGNLTRDPEVKYIPSGLAVADFGLAVNRQSTDKSTNERKEEVTFVDITLWGREAELAGEYLAKGRSVLVEGRLQMDSWDDKQTGQKRTKLKVVGDRIQFLGSAPGAGGEGGGAGGGGGARSNYRGNSGDGGGGSRPTGGGGRSQPPSGGGEPDYYSSGPAQQTGGAPDDDVPF